MVGHVGRPLSAQTHCLRILAQHTDGQQHALHAIGNKAAVNLGIQRVQCSRHQPRWDSDHNSKGTKPALWQCNPPLSPLLMRKSLSRYVVSSLPLADSGAFTGSMPSTLNCLNCTATQLLDSGVMSALTCRHLHQSKACLSNAACKRLPAAGDSQHLNETSSHLVEKGCRLSVCCFAVWSICRSTARSAMFWCKFFDFKASS